MQQDQGTVVLGSDEPDRVPAELRRLARRLGYRLQWSAETSRIPLADQVREWNADALLLPSTEHVDVLTLHAVMMVADVETVEPRLSFARWAIHPEVRSR
ncbi:hypothetical protein [Nocardia vermiculata]|uniref:Uncharacterized protein n=1 Tax=Nocardia vermiculata TaxID=257274 RepID=A0A846XYU7_9NOCA|nr:hypothetical protein [Nocardia vermiculata]NKY52243.1 hypothetical protein [Nocardia vermiculata]